MKRVFTLLFVLLLMVAFLPRCSKHPKSPEELLQVTETTAEETQLTTEAPTTETPITGELFLTVSEITLSVVGDQEDIYIGTVPRDRITWKSDDERIIKVDNGIIEAVGTGMTRVTATCEGQQVSCNAGCQASSKTTLAAMGEDVLRAPKRLAPQVPDDVLTYFENTALLGDSITYGFMKYEARNGRLGSPKCLCRGSLGIHNLLTGQLQLYYQGVETPVEDVVAAVAPEKLFILLGTNDVMVRSADTVLSELDQLLDRILAKSPDTEIYLQSVFPVVCGDVYANGTNERITAYNEMLKTYAEEEGHHYVPVAPYLQDHVPGFAHKLRQDEYHPSYEGVCAWIDALRLYAYVQQLEGA